MINKIFRFNELDSTQDEAKRFCDKYIEGTVIQALAQTKGRGKPGSKWHSPLGGLYFSIILKPQKDINDLLFVTKIAADVVVSVLASFGISSDIKLPNDVMSGGKKICGILVERSKDSLVIGVGLNLNIKEFPSELNAVSFELITGKTIDIDVILAKYLETFNIEYSKLLGNKL